MNTLSEILKTQKLDIEILLNDHQTEISNHFKQLTTEIELLKEKINSGKFPNKFEHFGGANLIITDDPDRRGYPQDVVIYTEHASAISWLVFELKDI